MTNLKRTPGLDEHNKAKTPETTKTLAWIMAFFSYILIMLPAALGLLYVREFGVSVVYGDAWAVVPLFDKWSSGTLQVSDLWDQHNSHRMIFPNIVYLLLGSVTRYDNVAEMFLIQGCFLGTLVVLLLAFRDNVKIQSPRLVLFLFVPVALLIFSLRQYKNMLFGFQINFAFAEVFGVLALFLLYLLGRRIDFGKLAFVAALASATVASYSVLPGLFVWPAGLLQLFLGPLEKPRKRAFFVLWGLVGISVWVVYFIGWVEPDSSSLLYTLQHPLQATHYYLNLLGSALFWRPNSALIGGLLLVCLALAGLLLIYRNGRLGEYSFWVSLLLYSLLMLGAITVGRSELGPDQAVIAKRYAPFPILAVVGVYVMLVKAALERRSIVSTLLAAALSSAILLSSFISYPEGIDKGRKERAAMEKQAFVLSTYESQSDEALNESFRQGADMVRERAPVLQRLRYNVFSEEP
jgi:hypothetical protein